MRHGRLARWLGSGALAALAVMLGAACCQAKEPFQAFLEGLRQRQMFDTARDYVESIRASSLVSEELKATIPFELGRTYVEEARAQPIVSDRLALLDRAREQFEGFLKESPDHALAGETSLELAGVIVERGRALVEAARRPNEAVSRAQHLADARKYFDEAQQVYSKAEERFDGELKAFPAFIDNKETAKLEARNRALLNAMQARLLKATVIYETAGTHDAGTRERNKTLEQAAAAYGAIYEQYERRLAGLYARMYQARCLQDLGNVKQALAFYGELLAQPDDPNEFRVLKRKTLRLAMLCWLDESEKKYDEAIRQGEAWLEQARGEEPQSPEGLAIRWLTARGYEQRALAYEGNDSRRGNDNKQALALAVEVARYRGDHQEDARGMLARLRPSTASGAEGDFASMVAAGKGALDALTSAQAKLRALEQAAGEESQLAEARGEVQSAQATALEQFRGALALRSAEVSLEEVNQVRYFLCYLHYVAGNYFDSAVLGEFLAERYPTGAGSKPAAKIALASYLALYNAAAEGERDFERARMVEMANLLTTRWRGSQEADEAWTILAELSIRSADYADAEKYLENIGADSPRRREAEIKAGQELWSAYLAAKRQGQNRASADELAKMSATAQALLERGLTKRLSGEAAEPSYAELSAELSLAQIYLEASAYDRAIALIERPDTGVLALMAAQSPLTSQGNFALEAYRAALRAYVGGGALDKAEGIMKTLEVRAEASKEGAVELLRVYASLGQELKDYIARLQAENKDAELKRVLKTFHGFLDRIATREQGNDFNSLAWTSETFYSMAEALDRVPETSAEAKPYFERAAKTCQRLIERAAAEPAFAPQPASLLGVRLRLARCERRLGNYAAARKQVVVLLGEQPNSLDAQIEAAHLYQALGAEDSESYTRASRGQKVKVETGRLVDFWGWSGIATRLRDNERFREQYYEAQYHVAECSYLRAMSKTGQERTSELGATARVIGALARLHPELGGDAWRGRFDALLKDVQRDLGQRPLGLKGLQQSATAQDNPRRAA